MPTLAPQTLARLYLEHAPALRLYARQWPTMAEDLVQEAFLKLARQSSPPVKVLAWLYKVVRNTALAMDRANARRRRREADAGPSEPWFIAADQQLDAADATR